jgi:arylsulfatase A-like enzyme
MNSGRPNILWYCTDQQRFDTIHALGNEHIRTPSIDRLVNGGTAFRRAYVQSQICTPSRASFLTGRYPATNHVHRNGNAYFPDNEVLVTKLLADAGYDCGLIGKLHLASAASGTEKRTDDGYRLFQWSHHPMPTLDPEFHAYHRWLRDEKGVDAVELYSSIRSFCCAGVPTELHQSTWSTDMAIRFIDEKRDGPWMLSMNPFDPHPPFDPPQEYLDRYDPESLPGPLFKDSDLERQKMFRNICQQSVQAVDPNGTNIAPQSGERQKNTATLPPSTFNGREVIAAYYAMIELLDDQFGRLVDHLDSIGELENTIIVFHSDHGELLGDHGLLYKGCRFFDGLVHVPLIFYWKGQFKSGLVSDALVELVDLAPTLLDAAGLEIPYFMQGRSLLDLLRGEASADHHKQSVVTEFNDALGSAQESVPTHATMNFDGRYKTVVYHGHDLGELFDLREDPGEFTNLWHDPEMKDLKSELLLRHLDAVMATSSAGIERTGRF